MATSSGEKEIATGQNDDNSNVKPPKDDCEKSTEAKGQGGYFVSKLKSHLREEALHGRETT